MGNFKKHYLLFGKPLYPHWQIFYAVGQIYIVINDQILKNSLAIWSHWPPCGVRHWKLTNVSVVGSFVQPIEFISVRLNKLWTIMQRCKLKNGQWLWISWQSGGFWYPRSEFIIQSFYRYRRACFYLKLVKRRKKRAGFLKIFK